ncbi:hypothetical protein GPL15_26420 [Clostridium sp. MCC353]|uniref:hypothetical protein n=1 Tax=Clostridium sp. MCC353 TaxID=2592646 RepID=UPI001C0168ED|nr:hypothetical protein [Clostridium sp. MCC353]MBT9780007.1 hypothetical protein [Clostridium sp. MCC353]
MVWRFTLKGEAIFENALTLYLNLLLITLARENQQESGTRERRRDWMFGGGPGERNPSGMKAIWKPLVKLRLQGWKKMGRN